jgi:PTS system mannose-specific IID component
VIGVLAQTFVRSFFLQTLWNFERLQNVGFAFGILPLLRRLNRTPADFQRQLRHQLEYFNTHPYFAPVVMGAIYAKEKTREGAAADDPTLTVMKNSMGGAFGAIGDHVIWGTWRPFCAVLIMSGVTWMAFSTGNWRLCARGWVIGFLVLFNTLHLGLRWEGLRRAAADGPMVVHWIQSLHLQAWAAQLRRVGLVILAVMILFYISHAARVTRYHWELGALLGALVLKRWALSGGVIFYAVVLLSLGLALFGAA